jgi:hypothetical protein
MTFKVTTIKTRPALNIYWVAAEDAGSTMQGDADTTGKLLTNTNTLSDDGLSITTVQIWASKQVYIDYISLPEVSALRLSRSIYQVTNMMSLTVSYEDVE